MLESPASDEELLFATDFLGRKFGERRHSLMTERLRQASVIKVDESLRDSAERAAMAHYRTQGWDAFWIENHLWKVLFGLVFWDELQVGSHGAKPSAFESRPTALLNRSFATEQKDAIQDKLSQLAKEGFELIEGLFEEHFGEENGIFQWRKSDSMRSCDRFLALAPPSASRGRPIQDSRRPHWPGKRVSRPFTDESKRR